MEEEAKKAPVDAFTFLFTSSFIYAPVHREKWVIWSSVPPFDLHEAILCYLQWWRAIHTCLIHWGKEIVTRCSWKSSRLIGKRERKVELEGGRSQNAQKGQRQLLEICTRRVKIGSIWGWTMFSLSPFRDKSTNQVKQRHKTRSSEIRVIKPKSWPLCCL